MIVSFTSIIVFMKTFYSFVLPILLFLCMHTADMLAQQSFVVSGADAKTGFGSVSVSVGQIITISDSARRGSISHGVQLPFEILHLPVGVNNDISNNIKAEAYPNPTFDFLKISIPDDYMQHIVRIADMNGSILFTQEFIGKELLLPMNRYASGMYIIDILENDSILSSFRIIKQ